MINLSVKIGEDEHEIAQIFGPSTAVDLDDPEQAQLIGMMVKDWAEGLLNREDL